MVVDGLGDRFGERAGVPDAGGAAVADEVEAERFEVVPEVGLVVVLGDDLGAGRHGGLDPGLAAEAARGSFAGDEAGGEHDVGVGRVGAAGDGGDDDRAVAELEGLAVRSTSTPWNPLSRVESAREAAGAVATGLAVGLVAALMPGVAAFLGPAADWVVDQRGGVHEGRIEIGPPLVLHVRERDAILRPLGPGEAGSTVAEVELEHVGVRILRPPRPFARGPGACSTARRCRSASSRPVRWR